MVCRWSSRNCSNNYGPNHFPEKLIPLFINNIITKETVACLRRWIIYPGLAFCKRSCTAIDLVFHNGKNGETYNIGGFNEWKNIDLVKLLCKLMDEKLGNPTGTSEQLITYVKDRPGHDRRYAIDASKINKELGWKPSVTFEEGLAQTIDWYFANNRMAEACNQRRIPTVLRRNVQRQVTGSAIIIFTMYFSHPTAVIDEGCTIGSGVNIWHFSHLSEGCRIGEECSLGQNVFIGRNVVLGKNVKVQNNVSVYEGVQCGDDVFIGPSVVFTNVINPGALLTGKTSTGTPQWVKELPLVPMPLFFAV